MPPIHYLGPGEAPIQDYLGRELAAVGGPPPLGGLRLLSRADPKQLSQWKTGASGTHRNSYPGGQYAYLAAAMPGFSSQILVISV